MTVFSKANRAFNLVVLVLCVPVAGLAQDFSTSAPSTDLPVDPSGCPSGCLPAPASDSSVWARSLSLGFSYTDGNSNTTDFHTSAAAEKDHDGDIWDFGATYSFGESDDEDSDSRETTKNEATAKASYKRLLTDRLFVGLGGAFKYDEVADIDYRFIVNPIIGSYIIRIDDAKFSVETGPSYIVEQVGGVENDYLAPRIADHFEWNISETAKVFQSAELLFEASNSENYIINAEAGVESIITSLLSLVLVVRDSYDNEPADDREKNDIAVISSLKVNL